jgi:hypothetical protein
MSVLLCKLGLASKDVCLYVLAPMMDRVSMAMLADAFGIEPICCEALYREAGRLGYWDICMRTQRYELANEQFACGEGAAIGGFVEKIVDSGSTSAGLVNCLIKLTCWCLHMFGTIYEKTAMIVWAYVRDSSAV